MAFYLLWFIILPVGLGSNNRNWKNTISEQSTCGLFSCRSCVVAVFFFVLGPLCLSHFFSCLYVFINNNNNNHKNKTLLCIFPFMLICTHYLSNMQNVQVVHLECEHATRLRMLPAEVAHMGCKHSEEQIRKAIQRFFSHVEVMENGASLIFCNCCTWIDLWILSRLPSFVSPHCKLSILSTLIHIHGINKVKLSVWPSAVKQHHKLQLPRWLLK